MKIHIQRRIGLAQNIRLSVHDQQSFTDPGGIYQFIEDSNSLSNKMNNMIGGTPGDSCMAASQSPGDQHLLFRLKVQNNVWHRHQLSIPGDLMQIGLATLVNEEIVYPLKYALIICQYDLL
jgi:hypothetical protein